MNLEKVANYFSGQTDLCVSNELAFSDQLAAALCAHEKSCFGISEPGSCLEGEGTVTVVTRRTTFVWKSLNLAEVSPPF